MSLFMETDKKMHEDLMWKLQADNKGCKRGFEWYATGIGGESSRKASRSNDRKAKMGRPGQMCTGFLSGGMSYRFAFAALRSLWEDRSGRMKQNSGDQCFKMRPERPEALWQGSATLRKASWGRTAWRFRKRRYGARPGKSMTCPLRARVDLTESYQKNLHESPSL